MSSRLSNVVPDHPDTDVEYPDTDVDSQARSRYSVPAVKSKVGSVVTQSVVDDDDVPPPLESATAPTATRIAAPTSYSSQPSPYAASPHHSPTHPTPEQFQAQQNMMMQHFQAQQRQLLQHMSTPEFLAETEQLFALLPPAVQKDLMKQLTSLPSEMRVAGRGQMTRQATAWARNPNQAFLLAGVKQNNISLVRMCVEELGADVNYIDEEGNCGLHWAVWYKIAPMAEYLISRQANPNIANSKGQSPIHWACMGGNLACIRVLVKARCHLDVQDKDGYFPTHAAAQHGKTAVLEYLKLNGADLHALDGNSRTVLHWTAFKNELITTQYLVNQGLSLDHRDTGGRLALHWAASQNNLDIVSYLVGVMEESGDFSALSCKDLTLDSTPLELAVAKNSNRVVAYLTDVESRLKLSKAKKLFQKIFCINQQSWISGDKVANDPSKSKFALYITIWIHSQVAIALIHHIFFMWPTFTEEIVSSSTCEWLILAQLIASAAWVAVHKSNPGYLPKNLSAMKTAFDRGNNPDGQSVAIPLTRRGGKNDDEDDEDGVDERSAMIQTEDDKILQDHFSYEQCLERGDADFICVTCRIVKPLRSKHCRTCDRCVSRFDHHCPWIDNCVGEGNHLYFVLFLLHMTVALSLYAWVCAQFLFIEQNQTAGNFLVTIPLCLHSILMTVYSGVLLFSQGQMIFNNLTTNEQFNGWRYKYMTRDPSDPKGRKMKTPFSEGPIKNFLSFCRLRPAKRVPITSDMTSVTDGPHAPSASSGGAQLAAAAFDWDGIEQLQQGFIVTPENEHQVAGVMRYLAFQKNLAQQQANGGAGHGHSHGGGGGHGHSHGGRECHGHN